jgi:oligopeptidase A
MHNPLLEWDTLPPFGRIRPEQVEPAVDTVLAENRAALVTLISQSAPTWDSLIEPLETLDDRLHRAWAPAAHLNAVMNNPEIRAAYNACLPKLADYDTEFGQNAALQRAYRALKDGSAWRDYAPAQRKLIDDALRDFRLAGVDLPADKKARFKSVVQELSRCEAKFEENILDATQGWCKHLDDESLAAGVPDTALQQARHEATSRKLTGLVFTLDYPSYSAIMTHADARDLRQEMYQAFATRASDQGPTAGRWDNSGLMAEILQLRHASATLTGFADYVEYSLASKMAKSPEQVQKFLSDLVQRVRPVARHEFLELSEYALERDGLTQLEAWDVSYYSEKLKEQRYHVSEELLRPYFPAPKVCQGLFDVMQRLYGIRLAELPGAEVWHPDVKLYEIRDAAGAMRGRLYFDLYARAGKRGGAWMDDALNRRRLAGQVQTPLAFLTCNFPAPVGGNPSLLSHEDVLTLFHEFGHCLQHLLTQVDYPSVAGINGVAWDAVELPSQFHENFAWTRAGLALVSGHYQSGAPLPDVLFDKLQGARHFHTALRLLRQLEFGLFDLEVHLKAGRSGTPGFVQGILAEVRRDTAVVPVPAWNRFAHSFSHVFAGGYAAGYYSYLWAEVLAADAYGAFEETGIFNPDTGRRFMASILEQGGSREAMDLFVEFRGREPRLDAFLRLNGLAA